MSREDMWLRQNTPTSAKHALTPPPAAVPGSFWMSTMKQLQGYAYDAVQLLENQKTNGKEEIMAENDTIPRVMMTTDELSRLAQIQPTISDIVDRYINQWVTGGVTDDNWNAYLGELQSAGVEELVSIYQSAVDRSSK